MLLEKKKKERKADKQAVRDKNCARLWKFWGGMLPVLKNEIPQLTCFRIWLVNGIVLEGDNESNTAVQEQIIWEYISTVLWFQGNLALTFGGSMLLFTTYRHRTHSHTQYEL